MTKEYFNQLLTNLKEDNVFFIILGIVFLSGLVFYFFDLWQQLNKQRIELNKKEQDYQAKKQELIDYHNSTLKLLDELKRLGTDNMYVNPVEINTITPHIYTIMPDKKIADITNWRKKEKDHEPFFLFMVINIILTKLNGRCSYRDVYAELAEFNRLAKEAGQPQMKISEKRVRRLINSMVFKSFNRWPVIQVEHDVRRSARLYDDYEADYDTRYIVVNAKTQGGYSWAMIRLDDIFNNNPIVSISRKTAENGVLSAELPLPTHEASILTAENVVLSE